MYSFDNLCQFLGALLTQYPNTPLRNIDNRYDDDDGDEEAYDIKNLQSVRV